MAQRPPTQLADSRYLRCAMLVVLIAPSGCDRTGGETEAATAQKDSPAPATTIVEDPNSGTCLTSPVEVTTASEAPETTQPVASMAESLEHLSKEQREIGELTDHLMDRIKKESWLADKEIHHN